MYNKGSKHLTYTKRLIIESCLKAKIPVSEIADRIKVNRSTVYAEIKRGSYTRQVVTYVSKYGERHYKYVTEYSADIGDQHYKENLSFKGRPIKLGNDYEFVKYVEKRILEDKFTPCMIIGELKKNNPFKTKISKTTLYRYIREGVFLHIEMTDLVSYKKKKRYQKATAKRPPRGTSIELRPEEIDSRTTFGNWEMDCVVGPSLAVLLVFTERQTRKELIMRLKDRKAKTVVAAIDFLERKFGDKFDKMFKSITVDNGSEFSDVDGLERSFFDDSVCRTKMYYCYPYTSCERGSNERMNRDIRRFFPKGTDFEKVSDTEIIRVERLLNNFPREVLGYSTPQSLYESALANL
jgi:IS30 family transposase